MGCSTASPASIRRTAASAGAESVTAPNRFSRKAACAAALSQISDGRRPIVAADPESVNARAFLSVAEKLWG